MEYTVRLDAIKEYNDPANCGLLGILTPPGQPPIAVTVSMQLARIEVVKGRTIRMFVKRTTPGHVTCLRKVNRSRDGTRLVGYDPMSIFRPVWCSAHVTSELCTIVVHEEPLICADRSPSAHVTLADDGHVVYVDQDGHIVSLHVDTLNQLKYQISPNPIANLVYCNSINVALYTITDPVLEKTTLDMYEYIARESGGRDRLVFADIPLEYAKCELANIPVFSVDEMYFFAHVVYQNSIRILVFDVLYTPRFIMKYKLAIAKPTRFDSQYGTHHVFTRNSMPHMVYYGNGVMLCSYDMITHETTVESPLVDRDVIYGMYTISDRIAVSTTARSVLKPHVTPCVTLSDGT